jgi:hypothetical protein
VQAGVSGFGEAALPYAEVLLAIAAPILAQELRVEEIGRFDAAACT